MDKDNNYANTSHTRPSDLKAIYNSVDYSGGGSKSRGPKKNVTVNHGRDYTGALYSDDLTYSITSMKDRQKIQNH